MVLKRRELVSRLRLRGLSLREITAAMGREDPVTGEPAFLNPRTGKPYSIRMIHLDVRWATELWMDNVIEAVSLQKGRMLAEIAEAKKVAWADRDLPNVLKAIQLETNVRGLNAPTRIAGSDGGALVPQRIEVVFVEAEGGGSKDGVPDRDPGAGGTGGKPG